VTLEINPSKGPLRSGIKIPYMRRNRTMMHRSGGDQNSNFKNSQYQHTLFLAACWRAFCCKPAPSS
jgi:hypothetical protein